jgi:tetratricopeptide (TPR) repeat protein
MNDALLALGPALFGLLGAVAGALIAMRATASERRVEEDNTARDNVLELLLLVDVHGGRYAEGAGGSTEYVVSTPPEPVAVLWERLRKARVDLLAAGFRWPVTSLALGGVWTYVDRLRARDEEAQGASDADDTEDANEAGPSPTLSPDADLAASARDAYFALSEVLQVLDRSRRYRRSWRCARRFGLGLADLHPWMRRALSRWRGLWSTEERLRATYYRGRKAEAEGDVAAALRAYGRAARRPRRAGRRSPHPSGYAASAAAALGRLRWQQGDLDRAAEALTQAAESRVAEVALDASLDLGAVRAELGDVDGARAALTEVCNCDDPALAARGWLYLGAVCADADDPLAAVGALRQAMDTGEDSVAADAALRLGDLLAGQQDAAGAMSAYRFAHAHGSADVSAAAADAIEQFQRGGQLWVPATGRGNPVQAAGVRVGGERDG